MFAGCVLWGAVSPGGEPARARPEAQALLPRLYEACRVRQLQTGQFPAGFHDLTGVLSEEMRRRMPARVEFRDPESSDNRLRRRSPIGDRTPCLRVELENGRWLNVSAGGWLYESDRFWETEFVHLLPRPFMNPELLARDARPIPQRATLRSPECGSNQVDIVPWCDALPDAPWFFGPVSTDDRRNKVPGGETAASAFGDLIRPGVQEHQGILFDVRGVIQLDGRLQPQGPGVRWLRSYPREVAGIVVRRPARRLHFLAGTIGQAEAHAPVAVLRLRFASGQVEDMPLHYAEHVAAADDRVFTSARLHPRVPNPSSDPTQVIYSLHHVCFTNPRSNAVIETIDFVSGMTLSHPYLLALTVQP
jgi:hypothetical protein